MLDSIGSWIAEHITEPLQEMIINSVNGVFVSMLNDAVDTVTSTLGHELSLIDTLLNNSYISQAVTYSITLALILLGVRIAFEAFQTYMAYSTGQENHPGELLKKAASATALIVSTPWIAKQSLIFSLSIVDDIMSFQAVPSVESIIHAIVAAVFGGVGLNLVSVLLLLAGIVLWLFLLIQIAVRAVFIALLMIIGPWMWAFNNELGRTWFKALLGQCFAIPIQMFLLRGALGSLASVGDGTVFTGPLLFIGFLWAALKFPAFLQQLVAQTGVGSAIGGTAQHVGTAVVIRKMMMRG